MKSQHEKEVTAIKMQHEATVKALKGDVRKMAMECELKKRCKRRCIAKYEEAKGYKYCAGCGLAKPLGIFFCDMNCQREFSKYREYLRSRRDWDYLVRWFALIVSRISPKEVRRNQLLAHKRS